MMVPCVLTQFSFSSKEYDGRAILWIECVGDRVRYEEVLLLATNLWMVSISFVKLE